ncbi:MAG: divalent metal cation transporter [Bacteroidetes bacterium]|nr:divalent metal cation transporter [Bacteroidota bacterium]
MTDTNQKINPKTKEPSRFKKFLASLGPGLITGASDDDPSGIVTYTQAGAQFGFATLWTALLTFPLMAAMQGMAARIGLCTSQGLTGTLKRHYPKWVLYGLILFCFPAIILNIGADIQGMGAVANLLLPGIPAFSFSIFFTGLMMYMIIQYPYQKMASILKWLCLGLLLYLIVPFLVHPDWKLVARSTFIPTIHLDKDFAGMLVAILGTTISPYLFFWQATMEVEDKQQGGKRKIIVDKRVLSDMRSDVNVGMFSSNLVMFFVILTAGTVLFNAGVKKIDTVEQAAKALEPLAGKLSYSLFAIGVIGTGFLAIPVLAGCLSYIIAETFNFPMGLDKKFNQAKPFYSVVIISLVAGLCMQFLGLSPVKALLYTAILYGLTSPVMIAVILHIGNNKKIMGKNTNSLLSNVLGFLTLILMTAAAVALIWFQF